MARLPSGGDESRITGKGSGPAFPPGVDFGIRPDLALVEHRALTGRLHPKFQPRMELVVRIDQRAQIGPSQPGRTKQHERRLRALLNNGAEPDLTHHIRGGNRHESALGGKSTYFSGHGQITPAPVETEQATNESDRYGLSRWVPRAALDRG